jgi:hypothetical protein
VEVIATSSLKIFRGKKEKETFARMHHIQCPAESIVFFHCFTTENTFP